MDKFVLSIKDDEKWSAQGAQAARLLRDSGIADVRIVEVTDPLDSVLKNEADATLFVGTEFPYTLPAGLAAEGVLQDKPTPADHAASVLGLSADRTEDNDAEVIDFGLTADKGVSPAFDGLLVLVCRSDDREAAEALHQVSVLEDMERFAVEQCMQQMLGVDKAIGAGIHADVENDIVTIHLAVNDKELQRQCPIGSAKKMCAALKTIAFAAAGEKGAVTIIGAGCGIDLITVRGLRAVRKADVIVYESYKDSDILAEARSGACSIYAGDMTPAERNAVIFREAEAGGYVAVLLRGDPFASGEGENVVKYLKDKDMPFDIIPGVPTVTAFPERAGIPYIYDGISNTYTIVTITDIVKDNTNYDFLGANENTVLFHLAEKNVHTVAGRLVSGGRSSYTPAALLKSCYEPGAKAAIGTIGNISRSADPESNDDCILLVGDVVAYNYSATRKQALSGVSVTVAGTRVYTHEMAAKLTELGAVADVLPYLRVSMKTADIPLFLKGYESLLFTNPASAESFLKGMRRKDPKARLPHGIKIMCIGPDTAEKLREFRLAPSHVFPDGTMYPEMARVIGSGKFLLVCGDDNRAEVAFGLKEAEADFDSVSVYKLSVKDSVLENFKCRTNFVIVSGGSAAAVLNDGTVDLGKAVPLLADHESGDAFMQASDKYKFKRVLRAVPGTPAAVIRTLTDMR